MSPEDCCHIVLRVGEKVMDELPKSLSVEMYTASFNTVTSFAPEIGC